MLMQSRERLQGCLIQKRTVVLRFEQGKIKSLGFASTSADLAFSRDIGGTASTVELGDAVCQVLKQILEQ